MRKLGLGASAARGLVLINVSFQSELPVREEPVLHRSVSAGSFDWKLTFLTTHLRRPNLALRVAEPGD